MSPTWRIMSSTFPAYKWSATLILIPTQNEGGTSFRTARRMRSNNSVRFSAEPPNSSDRLLEELDKNWEIKNPSVQTASQTIVHFVNADSFGISLTSCLNLNPVESGLESEPCCSSKLLNHQLDLVQCHHLWGAKNNYPSSVSNPILAEV